MELSSFDPIVLDRGAVQYVLSAFTRPPRGLAPDFEPLDGREARWLIDDLLADSRAQSLLRAALRAGAYVGERDALFDAVRREAERGTLRLHRRFVRAVLGTGQREEPPAPPALGPETTPQKTWFEVKVVDVYGNPVDGADVLFTQAGLKEKLKTNGNGIARWKDVDGASFATAKLASPSDLREALKDRWGTAEPAEELAGEKASILDDEISIALTSETPGTIVLFRPLTRVRLLGMHFDTNKCFLRERAMNGIRTVVSVYQAYPDGKLLIVGHTDTTGDDAYNLDLSLERAEAVKAYLKDDVAAWEAWFGGDKPAQKRWGAAEVHHMIQALPCAPTITAFQQWSNDTRGTSLEVDGVAGPKTRKALIEAYMALDGTTLPDGVEAVVHGCGEFFPMNDAGDAYGKDNVASEEDRRVEMFCFDQQINPPVPGPKASKGEPQYAQWQKQVTDDVDLQAAAATLVAVDDVTKELMPNVSLRVLHPDGNVHTYVTNSKGEAFVAANVGDVLTVVEIIHETHSSLTRVASEA